MGKHLILIALFAVGCHHDAPPTDPTGPSVLGEKGGDDTDHSGNMVSPDKMDEIQRDLGRQQMIVSHCLATAMENGDVKKSAHGKVALEMTITPEGKATDIKLIKTDIESKSVTDCVIRHVQDISFPQIKKPLETSYTYAMEAN